MLTGLVSLSAVGCGQTPTKVVEVERPVFLPPPGACLVMPPWDAEAEPGTNGELWASWLSRGRALAEAAAQLECVRAWAQDSAQALPGASGEG